jgi:CheY-like chemotaxis protein
MNAILGFAQLLEHDPALDDDQQDSVREILRAGRHLLELINEVLDLARIESGHINLSMEAVPVADLIDDCRQLVQPLAAARGIALQGEIDPALAVRADRTRLKQVLLNLLSNAVKYNRDGGQIMLRTCRSGTHALHLEVEDSGPGIAPQRLGELFQPFNRLGAEHTEVEGTGIGLTITRRLVEMMGGTIEASSTPGVGTTFRVTLPLHADKQPDAPAALHVVAHGLPAENHTTRCVLCIDDNPVNLKLIAQMLTRRPQLRLLTAHAAELGLELARAHRPDLILLDINMPGLDGYQVLRLLRDDPCLRATPVMAVTANALPRDIERGRAAGFAEYLAKPLELQPFLAAVDACLARTADGAPSLDHPS